MLQARQVMLEAAIQSGTSQSQKDRCQMMPLPQGQLPQSGSYRQAVESCLPGLGEWRNKALFFGDRTLLFSPDWLGTGNSLPASAF